MNKNVKPKKKMEYYSYQIDRGEEVVETKKNLNASIITGIKKQNDYAEMVGYHLDPSRYDTLRHPNFKNKISNIPTKDPAYNTKSSENNKVDLMDDEEKENEVIEHFEDNSYIDSYLNTFVEERTYSVNDYTEFPNDVEDNEYNDDLMDDEDTPIDVKSNNVIPNNSINEGVNNNFNNINDDKTLDNNSYDDIPYKPTKGKYVPANLSLLPKDSVDHAHNIELAEKQKAIINRIINEYKLPCHVDNYIFGPTVIVFLVNYDKLNIDVRCIQKLESNLLTYLEVKRIRMLTPIPGRSCSGIEVPLPSEQRGKVHLRDVLESKEFKNNKMELPAVVGRNNYNENIVIDITELPHAIAGGQTKSGKSVCLNMLIMSLICSKSPDDVRLILLDPKRAEFNKYAHIPHLAMPVITDEQYFEPAMQWVLDEMERRYSILEKYGCVDLKEMNEELLSKHQPKIPYLVVIMDEFNDWFASASQNLDSLVVKILQKARAAGISMILATQHPSADVIKGSIKANIAGRFTFSVSDSQSSVIMLGQGGAEKLEGYGDMILRATGITDTRLQGAFATNKDIRAVLDELRETNEVNYLASLEELKQSSIARGVGNGIADPKLGRNDELFTQVARFVVENNNPSVNQLTRMYGTGVNRMDNIFRDLELFGIVSEAKQGTKREVLVKSSDLEEILKANNLD